MAMHPLCQQSTYNGWTSYKSPSSSTRRDIGNSQTFSWIITLDKVPGPVRPLPQTTRAMILAGRPCNLQIHASRRQAAHSVVAETWKLFQWWPLLQPGQGRSPRQALQKGRWVRQCAQCAPLVEHIRQKVTVHGSSLHQSLMKNSLALGVILLSVSLLMCRFESHVKLKTNRNQGN